MMSVEMARTTVGRTTIECCVRWCATRCAGSETVVNIGSVENRTFALVSNGGQDSFKPAAATALVIGERRWPSGDNLGADSECTTAVIGGRSPATTLTTPASAVGAAAAAAAAHAGHSSGDGGDDSDTATPSRKWTASTPNLKVEIIGSQPGDKLLKLNIGAFRAASTPNLKVIQLFVGFYVP